jgi:hypothetical protein
MSSSLSSQPFLIAASQSSFATNTSIIPSTQQQSTMYVDASLSAPMHIEEKQKTDKYLYEVLPVYS